MEKGREYMPLDTGSSPDFSMVEGEGERGVYIASGANIRSPWTPFPHHCERQPNFLLKEHEFGMKMTQKSSAITEFLLV